MSEPEKPNWGNRIILLVFGVLAVVTIGATIISTTGEWNASDAALQSDPPAEPTVQ